MYNDKGRLVKTEAKIFTSEDDYLLSEILKLPKNPRGKAFDAMKRDVSERWEFLTGGLTDVYVLDVNVRQQRPSSYAFSFKKGFHAKEGAFDSVQGSTHAIPAGYASPEADKRLDFIETVAHRPTDDVLTLASLYAEAAFYLSDAVEDATGAAANDIERLGLYIGRTQEIVMTLEDHLNKKRPGMAIDLDASVEKSWAGVRSVRKHAAYSVA